MYRDPSEFRERFKAYKDGKSVREIYGLPGYEPGKLPVEEMMPYILAVENPTKQGLVNGVWRPPTDSTKWDVHAIGGGLDIREQHNPIVYNYLKTNGRLASPFLTAREEEVLREKVFKKTMLPALLNVYNKYGDKISSKGYARLAGMKWQGHPFLMAISPDSVTGKAFIKAIESGDKDLDSVFDAYYKYPANAKRYAARILADTNYWKNHNTVATKPVPQEPIIAVPDATRVATTIPQEKTIPIADPRNATIAEAERAMWAHAAFENMPKVSDMPIWKSPSLPALEPIELDVTPFKYNNGKLPGYSNGKIRIKPANRGKFNATKKRTGKTTEELTHSKNPLTRKRAVFALNAKKWHHANGKLPRYGDGIIGDIVDAYDKFVETDPYNIATMMSFLPIIGTGMDIREAVKNPTAENIGYATLSGITDVVGGRIFAKLAGTAMKAKKAAKAARKAEYEFWKDTPFILNKPKAEAKRTLKFYMDRAADNAYNNVVSDPTFRVPGFEIAAGLGAGYGLDFVANINLHKQNK